MSPTLLAIVLVALTATAASAAPVDVVVVTAPGAAVPPGVIEETRAAIAGRVAALALPPAVVRITLDADAVELLVDGKSRRIAIVGWHDGTALRLVVLHVVDLAAPAPALGALEPLPVLAPPPVEAERTARPPRPRGWLVVSAAQRLARGVSKTDPLAPGFDIAADVGAGRLRVGVAVGWSHGMRAGDTTPQEAVYDTWPVRLSASLTLRSFDLVASAIAAPYRFGGVREQSGVTLGGGLAVRGRLHLFGPIDGFVSVGADGFAHRVQLQVGAGIDYSTPRLAPYAALGVAWRVTP